MNGPFKNIADSDIEDAVDERFTLDNDESEDDEIEII